MAVCTPRGFQENSGFCRQIFIFSKIWQCKILLKEALDKFSTFESRTVDLPPRFWNNFVCPSSFCRAWEMTGEITRAQGCVVRFAERARPLDEWWLRLKTFVVTKIFYRFLNSPTWSTMSSNCMRIRSKSCLPHAALRLRRSNDFGAMRLYAVNRTNET